MPTIRPLNILYVVGVLILSGCTTSNQFAVASYDSDGQLMPEISVYRGDRDSERTQCAKHRKDFLKYCQFDVIDLNLIGAEFRATKLFESVRIARPGPRYKIHLTQVLYDTENASELSNAVISGATLFLAPMNIDAEMHVIASITDGTEEVSKLSYRIPFTQAISLFGSKDIKADLARSIVSHIVSDIQKDKLIHK